MTSKALQFLIPSGEPNGVKMVKLSGWDGLCYLVPRQSLNELTKDSDISNPGLYFLFGKDESSNGQLAYIGESESFLDRITSHHGSKDFWDEAVVFTGELNKAHVKYLEHMAVDLAKAAGRMELTNSNTPSQNKLSEFDRVAVDLFFTNTKFILETLGYEIYSTIDESVSGNDSYYLKGKEFDAAARLLDNGGMIVLAGSLASIAEAKSFGGWAKVARQQFLLDGSLVIDGEQYRFTQDITFRSPSAAAATVAARSINGWTAWKDNTGNTLDDNVRK